MQPITKNSLSVIDALKAIREKIGSSERWTRHGIARTRLGMIVSPLSTSAVCWCLKGAIDAVCGDKGEIYNDVFDVLVKGIHSSPYARDLVEADAIDQIIEFNDLHTHEQVIEVIDRAIQLDEKV
jgi:hypothetical protein